MTDSLTCFKAYDVRGKVPEQLNEDVAYRIGRAFVDVMGAKSVVVGYDIRLSSENLKEALVRGLREQGADVIDIGLCGTEEVYFATAHLGVDGGIIVTASHNPKDYNGMKFVAAGARPISSDSGLLEIKARAEEQQFITNTATGQYRTQDTRDAYIEHLLAYVDDLPPLKIVSNAGNGGAGLVLNALTPKLPMTFISLHNDPDGTFPVGVPNPLLVENREETAAAVRAQGADMGIAWDGDFDRCFFFDHTGAFIEGYYIVGLLADAFLERGEAQPIVHDPRLTWNTRDICAQYGAEAVQSRTGHAFMKAKMREADAVYGGEMSAHHYFRDFAYCDSGMIPWLLVADLMGRRGKSLAELVAERQALFPCSGEINREVADPRRLLRLVEEHYASGCTRVDHIDGLSVEYHDWRFNLRLSNTEPVVRLNVEARGDAALMQQKTEELLGAIDRWGCAEQRTQTATD